MPCTARIVAHVGPGRKALLSLKTCVEVGTRQRVSFYCQSAIVWDVVGHAQVTPCRTDADNPARPSLTDKCVLL